MGGGIGGITPASSGGGIGGITPESRGGGIGGGIGVMDTSTGSPASTGGGIGGGASTMGVTVASVGGPASTGGGIGGGASTPCASGPVSCGTSWVMPASEGAGSSEHPATPSAAASNA